MENVKNFTPLQLERIIIQMGWEKYRAQQICAWLYEKKVQTFEQMKNLSLSMISELSRRFSIQSLVEIERKKSKDNTVKTLYRLKDGNLVESVVIYSHKRRTLCISTQAGCKQGCVFCASGKHGFKRNLEVCEILDQILEANRKTKEGISNYVFMGMGEPLDNYKNVIKAIRIMNDKKALNIGIRKITLSTCGITKKIEKLANEKLQINLSISLHAVTDKKRSRLMPVNKVYHLQGVVNAARKYFEKTGRLVTLEYTLIKGENDTPEDVSGLIAIARKINAKVNLIAYMPVEGCSFESPNKKEINVFINALEKGHIKVTLRESKGRDIQGACGQLAGTERIAKRKGES